MPNSHKKILDNVVVAALGDGRVVELLAGEVDLGQVMHQWKFTGCAPGNIMPFRSEF